MIFLIIPVITIISILLGKLLFRKWFNHITLYCTIWSVSILLYELKLLPYADITLLTWFYITSSFLSFMLGVFTIISARDFSNKNQIMFKQSQISLPIFSDDGKALKYSIILFSLIALYAAYQHWSVLIKMFGSIPSVFLNANRIYRMNSEGEIKGIIPYISYFGYVAVFLSAIYTAYKKKFSFLTFLPLIAVIIKELANVGRAGMLFALLEFLLAFILFRHLLADDLTQTYKFSKKNALIAATILILFFVISSSLVRITRGSTETYTGTSRGLKQLKDNIFVSPSLYLYLSSDVGVFNQYLSFDGEDTKFGQNTFLPVYDLLAKFGMVERPEDFQKGYFIPMWTNTGTFIRELHADFGMLGPFIGPYFIGLLITWMWFWFFEKKKLVVFAVLVYLNLIIGFSFLVMVTRLLYWFISLIILVLLLPIIEKIAESFSKKSIRKI